MKLSLDNRNIFLRSLKNLEVSIGRTIVFAYLQGSQNYDLETPSSDMDGKAFCLPSLDDLYDGSFLSKTFDYPQGQITIHDVRMLPELLEKMNPTYLESSPMNVFSLMERWRIFFRLPPSGRYSTQGNPSFFDRYLEPSGQNSEKCIVLPRFGFR